MNKLILITFLMFSALALKAQEAPLCKEMVITHMMAIESSEQYISELHKKEKDISPFEITQLQKKLTARFGSLKGLMELYKSKEMNCSPKILAPAIAVYDMSHLGKSIFAHANLRRIVLGFSKFPRYRLTDLVSTYKKYTEDETIVEIQEEIERTSVTLPDGIILNRTHHEYDPNLYALSDAAIKGTTSVIAGMARVWGFISDQLKWRQGRLNQNDKAIELVKSTLRPLDLLYEKRTFTLSNYTIPGHWGHVAVWLGTKEELQNLGIWDKEFFRPFRPFIEAGFNIVEVRKEGLNFQSVESFLNLDEFAVTRIEGVLDRAQTVYEELSEQIEKKYDFKFDARSADRITCAELISFSYGDIKWPMTKTLFQQVSLRPDDLAVLSLDEKSPVNFVLFLKGTKDHDLQQLDVKEWNKLFEKSKHVNPEEEKAHQEAERKKYEEWRKFNEQYLG